MWLEIIKKLSKVVGKKVAPNAQLPGIMKGGKRLSPLGSANTLF